jgi:hypothetical protein
MDISNSEAYKTYVGSITPQEFIKGCEDFEDPIDEAVKDYLRNFPFAEPIPSGLEDALYKYISGALDD